MINSNIIGYDLVKNVKKAVGEEYTNQDKLFVVRWDCGGDYLSGLCEVCENTRENYAKLRAKYSESDYHIWFGCIVTLPKGCYALPEGGDMIEFYWS